MKVKKGKVKGRKVKKSKDEGRRSKAETGRLKPE